MEKQMKNNVKEYDAPVCSVLSVGTQSIICSSETEKVGETEGQW